MSTQLIPILDPTRGLFTNVDQDDIEPGFATELDNFYLDRPGKLVKREGALFLDEANSFNALRTIAKIIDPDFTNAAQWLAWEKIVSTSYGKIWYSDDAATWNSLFAPSIAVDAYATPDEMIVWRVFQIIRMCMGPSFKPQHYQYYKRKFFADLYDHSDASPVWAIADAVVAAPTTPTYTTIAVNASGGSLKTGFYVYKITALYDGLQETLLAGGAWQLQVTSSDVNVILLKLDVDKSQADWSPRVLFYNIYRSFDEDGFNDNDGNFQLIESVSTQNLYPRQSLTMDATMGKIWHDTDKPWGSQDLAPVGTDPLNSPNSSDTKYRLKITSTGLFYNILSNGAGSGQEHMTLNDWLPANVGYYSEAYTIELWTYNGSWSVTTSGLYPGTEGYGGRRCYHEENAAWDINEWTNEILNHDSSTYGLVIANDAEVLVLNTTPTTGTSKAILMARHLWKYGNPIGTLYFMDYGLLDKGVHPLAGITSIEANYRYAVQWQGRSFVQNVALDPDGDNELHPDWGMFSEIGQLDVIPNVNFLPPLTKRGGVGLGIVVLEDASRLVYFYRNAIGMLSAPRADTAYWDHTLAAEGMGVFNQASYDKTPFGIVFASDSGLYLIDNSGRLIDTPLSGPIEDEWLTAATNASAESNFSVMYMPAKRLIYVKMSSSETQIHVLRLDSIRGNYPQWSKMQLGTISAAQVKMSRSTVDEAGKFYFHGWQLDPIYTLGSGQTGTESFTTKFKSAYFRLGSMAKDGLFRYLRIAHKGLDAITPTILLDDGATSAALTAIAAANSGEHRTVNVKRRGRNAAVQLVSAASTTIDHEIRGLEMEVDSL